MVREYWNLLALDDKFSNKDEVTLFCIAKQIRKQYQDTVGEKCVKDDDNKLAYSDIAKKNAWKQHYQRFKSFFGLRLRCLRLSPQ